MAVKANSMRSKKRKQQREKRETVPTKKSSKDQRQKGRKSTWSPEEVKISQEMLLLKQKVKVTEQKMSSLVADLMAARQTMSEDIHTMESMRDRLNELAEMRKRNLQGTSQNDKENTPPLRAAPQVLENDAPSTPSVPVIGQDSVLFYSLSGRAGKVKIQSDGVILAEDLLNGLSPLPFDIDNERSETVRVKRPMDFARYGRSTCWIPAGTELVSKSYLTKLKESATIVKNMKDLFGSEKCVYSKEALTRLAAWNLHNYGGSDEATQMIMAGTLDTLFHEIGFDDYCTPYRLAKGVPST